jgi:hypothetical protein
MHKRQEKKQDKIAIDISSPYVRIISITNVCYNTNWKHKNSLILDYGGDYALALLGVFCGEYALALLVFSGAFIIGTIIYTGISRVYTTVQALARPR